MRPCILTIAGSDSGGGAGVQADSRVIRALGGHALNAITAITAQSGLGVKAWEPVSGALLRRQIEAVRDGFSIAAAKTGLLPGRKAIAAVAEALPADVPLVVDPILGSTSGTRFFPPSDVRFLVKVLFPRATLITPNWPEAELLSGVAVKDLASARVAAERLLALGANAVLVKGGHGVATRVDDLLLTAEGVEATFASWRIGTSNTHGTGCVLSAAIATGLARGRPLVAAIEDARKFLTLALAEGASHEWQGRGPAFAGW